MENQQEDDAAAELAAAPEASPDPYTVLSEQEPDEVWRPDLLEGFEQLTMGLDFDEEGQNLGTLVRPTVAVRDPHRTPILALHGWSDYFYNAPLARAFEAAGYAFHALDLRHYGRSLRAGQTPGQAASLDVYGDEIGRALRHIARDHPYAPVLLAHSTGGLVAALWADRHPGRLAALVLNSPWLEMQGSSWVRALATAIVDPIARVNDRRPLKLPKVDHYWRSLSSAGDGEWDLHELWRPQHSFEVTAGWIRMVMDGHARVAKGLDIDAPIHTAVAKAGYMGTRPGEHSTDADIILDPVEMASRSLRLGDRVTVSRHPGAIHDVFASAEPIRRAAFAEVLRWLRAYAPTRGHAG